MYEAWFWLVVASPRSPCSLVSSSKPQKSHLCPVRGCCRLRWRKAGLELEPKAQNGKRGCGGSTRSSLGSPRRCLPRRISAHMGSCGGRGNCFHLKFFFCFCFQVTWFLCSLCILMSLVLFLIVPIRRQVS